MNKTIDMMVKLLEKNNIPLLEGTRKKEEGSSSENKEQEKPKYLDGGSNPSKDKERRSKRRKN